MSKKGRKASSKLGGVATAVIGVLVVTLFVLHRVGVVDLDLLGEDTTSPSSGEASTELSGDRAQEQLSELRVEEEDDQPGYDRALFPHWNDNVEDNCTTRQVVLLRDGEDVEVDDDCQPDSGSWYSPYEGETFTDPQDIDIDHMVALKESWRSGAHAWTTEERQDFANDRRPHSCGQSVPPPTVPRGMRTLRTGCRPWSRCTATTWSPGSRSSTPGI